MSKLSTPVQINKTVSGAGNSVATITWFKAPDYVSRSSLTASFRYKLVNETNADEIIVIASDGSEVSSAPAITTSPDDTKITATITITGKDLDDYLLEVQAVPPSSSTDTYSDYGQETHWLAQPSLTVEIGGTEITLTKVPAIGAGVFRLAQPIQLLYTDLQDFVTSLNQGLTLPTTYPNGDPIDASLNIQDLIINTDKKLFALDFSVALNYDVIPGLSINKLGLVVKRTDGTI